MSGGTSVPVAGVLGGAKVLITRPACQAETLARAVETLGGTAIRFPTIDIAACCSAQTRRILTDIAAYDLAVFVSANAVRHAVPVVRAAGGWPATVPIGAVGPATAAALAAEGLTGVVVPRDRAGAQGLLARAELAPRALRGRRVVVLRGRGGLPLLGDELERRGARVCYAEVYERRLPDRDVTALNTRGIRGEIDIIVVTSAEALGNLFALAGDAGGEWLSGTQFLTISERIARTAEAHLLRFRPLIARGSSDREIVETLVQWREQGNRA